MFRWRSLAALRRAQQDLLSYVSPSEVVERGGPWGAAGACSWGELRPKVAAADFDDQELVVAAARAFDLQALLADAVPWPSTAETRATLAKQTLVSVRESPVAGLGVFADVDIEAGTVVSEYWGQTLVGAKADALTAVEERQLVWDAVSAEGGASLTAAEHAVAVREAYRKAHGFEAGGGASALVLGAWRDGATSSQDCGAIVNDGSALFLDGRGALDDGPSAASAATAAYQRRAKATANATMVPDGQGALFVVASRPIAKGDELFYPYGSAYWLGHARETLLDDLAVALRRGRGEDYPLVTNVIKGLEDASEGTIHRERELCGTTGAMRRSGAAPLPRLPYGADGAPPMLQLKLYERMVRLDINVAAPGADSAGGLRDVSPAAAAKAMPPFAVDKFEAFRASLPPFEPALP